MSLDRGLEYDTYDKVPKLYFITNQKMDRPKFNDGLSLGEAAEQLGKKAMELKLIPSFVVRHYPDSKQFYIPNEKNSEPLTPEEAYFQFKKLVEQAEK